MSLVGGFPGLREIMRMPVRAPLNPMDVSTVVSIYPRPIIENKCTLTPGTFELPAGSLKNPSIIHVGSSSWWKEVDPEQPLLEIPVYSTSVAESIVRDYCNGMLACNMSTAMPGLFFVPGRIDLVKLRTEYAKALHDCDVRQRNWYIALVRHGDVLWSRTNGNPLAISDLMRMAARELGLEKEWMRDFQMVEMVRCQACGAIRNPQYPVCSTCKAVDMSHPGAEKLKFAV